MLEDDGPSPKQCAPMGAGDGKNRHTVSYFISPKAVKTFGAPLMTSSSISLLVLRQSNFVGKSIPVSRFETVAVRY